ncbi:MAG: hypothetical protein EP343_16235 [Deltaproteobacteria bacterium]|nr:MAG: hypothetical protein EP343_16235 [Deltaproteobacteria bacterium]
MDEVIETQSAKLWLSDEGFTVLEFKPIEVTLEMAMENIRTHDMLSRSKRIPMLIYAAELKAISREARVYSSGAEANDSILALAIMINSPVAKVLGGLYLRVNKPIFPTKLFVTDDAAIAWLKGYVD